MAKTHRPPGSPPLRKTDPVGRVRLAELAAAISLFTDLGTGQPQQQAARSCVAAMRLAAGLRLSEADRVAVYYATLLRFLGCTADAHAAAVFGGGDELGWYAALAPTVMGSGREELAAVLRSVGAGTPTWTRLGLVGRALADPGGKERNLRAHCEVAARFGSRMGLPEGVAEALGAAYARWDGRGVPAGLSGTDIPVATRLAVVARDVELLVRTAGAAEAERILRRRSGHAYDPEVLDAALDMGLATLLPDDAETWELALSAEPPPVRVVDHQQMESVLLACADFVDLKFPHLAGHSRGVADLAAAAGAALGMPAPASTELRWAALVHDLGRVGVPAGTWMRPGRLSTAEWEAVRLHPYYTERILARCGQLADVARVAGSHHERLDGSGYHRGLDSLDRAARLLATADTYQAMTQDRPHRPAHPSDAAARTLRAESAAGRHGSAEVEAVLTAAGHRTGRVPPQRPAGLTEREVDVLRLLTRGLSNREVARRLGISAKTVGRHVENLYAKAGVSSRAAAAVFAMEHGIVTGDRR
jgi:HD-GYP domain-containing protein (c-di-GMP phosphodiesterase class II)/DNA-binding CsgD family transcriptional regulator